MNALKRMEEIVGKSTLIIDEVHNRLYLSIKHVDGDVDGVRLVLRIEEEEVYLTEDLITQLIFQLREIMR